MRANILMLDDIGAEEVTPWVRMKSLDHYRMVHEHELPTFFSSNFDYSELEHHLSITRDGSEKRKPLVLSNVLRRYPTHIILKVKIIETIEFYYMRCIIDLNLNR